MIVLKFGGELLEEESRLQVAVAGVAAIARRTPLAIVHGGGKEIDAALASVGLGKQQVDGLRITDDRTLEIVVSVLAGTINTRLVAALVTAGLPAVGLTGADAGCGLADPAPPHRTVDGRAVDLGQVGTPSEHADPRVVSVLSGAGFLPVVACVGLRGDGRLVNVNADTFAAHLAARLRAQRLVIAGTTPGVLDDRGATVPLLDRARMDRLIQGGTATAGMVAKLKACELALARGVNDVVIVDGRSPDDLAAAAIDAPPARATRLVAAAIASA